MLSGHCLALTELEGLDLRLPERGKIRMTDLVRRYFGPLTLAKRDLEAISRTAPLARSVCRPEAPSGAGRS